MAAFYRIEGPQRHLEGTFLKSIQKGGEGWPVTKRLTYDSV